MVTEMACLVTNTPQFYNDICDEIRLFLPQRKIELKEEIPQSFDGDCIVHRFSDINGQFTSTAVLYKDGLHAAEHTETAQAAAATDALVYKKLSKRIVKISVFRLLSKYFKKEMPWGALTGIRPSKLARELTEEYKSIDTAKEAFIRTFDVSEQKTKLAFEIAANQKEILRSVTQGDTDIYVGIPFCNSRCLYCSFASNDTKTCAKYIDTYLNCLFEEIKTVMDELKPKIRSVYIGGGTPTALDEKRLELLLKQCSRFFENPVEFTVEAGRPDTITKEKLLIIKDYARRISINPQTLNDDTLRKIGRAHTVNDFFEKYALARACGFDFINTDLIIGLPGETLKDVENTIYKIASLQPENVTVHSLAIKRASRLNEEENFKPVEPDEAMRMIALGGEVLRNFGYHPYYMYRQKYMSGNLENTGYAKTGFACVYNIDIMEETVSNLAFGAGAITKRVLQKKNRIERAPNVSDLLHYISRTKEMAERKLELFLRQG